ncbi:MAG: HAMP domain-containing sensor histidine kinase [Cyclobacteriaceae bacterium]
MSTVFVITYLFSNNYTDAEFFNRLKERANIVAQIHLEKDELSAHLYEEIRRKHVQILPNEREGIFRIGKINELIIQAENSFVDHLTSSFFEKLIKEQINYVKQDKTYYTGIVYTDNEGDFIVIASADNIFGQAKMNNLGTILIIALIFSLIALFFIGRYYAGKVLQPISDITNQVKEITGRNLHLRLSGGNSKDELTELSNTFNDLLDRLETIFDLQGSFINNASHELKNPLAAILGETEFILKRDRSAEEYKQAFLSIEKETQRLELFINSLLKLAQAGHENKGLLVEVIRLDELVFLAKNQIDEIKPNNNVILDLDLPLDEKALIIHGNLSLLLVALVNLIDNACKFSLNKEVVVKILTSANEVTIAVVDQGIGIPKSDLKKVLEPLYRSENARGTNGFGIGLPLVQKIIKIHKGLLTIESEFSKGTTVSISFKNIKTT